MRKYVWSYYKAIKLKSILTKLYNYVMSVRESDVIIKISADLLIFSCKESNFIVNFVKVFTAHACYFQTTRLLAGRSL